MTGDRVSRSCDVGPPARMLDEQYWGRVKLQDSMEYGATVVLNASSSGVKQSMHRRASDLRIDCC
jgi:hypothetical protein